MTADRSIIIAVDGPAGSGKSSVCSAVCQKLGWTYINTGALYRAVAVAASDRNVDVRDEQALASLVTHIADRFRWDPMEQRLYLEGEDLTDRLYSVAAGNGASYVASIKSVREQLLPVQRQLTLQSGQNALVDGRDIGTVVFPDADLKVFMTASLEERAKRRLHQLREAKGAVQHSLEEIKADIACRDGQDTARGSAPLKQADDAVVFDNSGLSVEESVDKLIAIFSDHGFC